MLFFVISFVSWTAVCVLSGTWISVDGGYTDDATSKTTTLVLIIYHYIAAIFLIIFYVRHRKWFKLIRLSSFEQRVFVFIGITAGIGNVSANAPDNTYGAQHSLPLFIGVTIHNGMLYLGIIFCVMILDSWNMSKEHGLATLRNRLSVFILALTQFILICLHIIIIFQNYYFNLMNGKITYLSFMIIIIYRLWRIYYGFWLFSFFTRKIKRFDCGIFMVYEVYEALKPNANFYGFSAKYGIAFSIKQKKDIIDGYIAVSGRVCSSQRKRAILRDPSTDYYVRLAQSPK